MSLVSVGAALMAGLLSFLSPCVLPLIPGYLSYISGCNAGEITGGQKRARVFLRTVFFVLGFSMVFTVLGIIFSGSGLILAGTKARLISFIAGGVIILFGLNMIFNFLSFLNREIRPRAEKKPSSALGSFVVGMAFGAGWTPCIGPMLASILLLAAQSGSLLRAFILLLVYSAGLAIPFLLTGLFFDRLTPLMRWFKKRGREIRIGSGILLTALGMLMVSGRLTMLNSFFSELGFLLRSRLSQEPLQVKLFSLYALGFLAASLLALAIVLRKKPFRILRFVLLALFSTLFFLELSGLLSSAELLSGWFLFQG